ncbi:MAG: hypothetical protein HYR74_10450 [Candidatus Eisenbacteria bacterium]|nr:hypothetical protein [Candidatus Eisenbacteria bacterium]
MKRAAIIVALAALVLWLLYLTAEGHGLFAAPAMRHLRAMKDRRDAPGDVETLTLDDFPGLPAHQPLEAYATLERQGVRVEAYVQRVEQSKDGDFHLTLVARPAHGDGRGDRYVTAEITPAWSRSSRTWTYARLADTLSAERAGTAPGTRWPPRRVRVTGWLMYDLWADALPDAAFDRGRRVSAWEIHPITRIEIWDAARGAFVDLPR